MRNGIAGCVAALSGLLLVAAPAAASALAFPLACSFVSRTWEMLDAERCVRAGRHGPLVAPAVVARLGFDGGLGQMSVRGMGWLYVRRDGRAAVMETLDNGPDPFAEGLARSRIGGKVAFLDRRLLPRIVTSYDWASPFAHGRADVCRGCRPVRVGEHSRMEGGWWGVIDRGGRVVLLTLDRPGGNR